MTESDSILLARLSSGDEQAFEALFLRHYNPVYRVVYSVVLSREAAEDLAQETFLELYRHTPAASAEASVLTWLCRVALNKGYNSLRGERRAQQRLERLAAPAESDPYDELLRAEERQRVRETLARLPERQSKMLLLRQAGLTQQEIAGVIGVAPGSVGTLLARAEQAFSKAYTSMNGAESEGSLHKRKL